MKIAVYGSAADASHEIKKKAREIGREIARHGHILVTGGCGGYPYEAVLGAREIDGRCIAYSPAPDLERHVRDHGFPTEGFSDFVFVPKDYEHIENPHVCRKYRNVSSVAASDACIFIGGRIGTMNEFTIAYDCGKRIGILENSGGISDNLISELIRTAGKESRAIIYDPNPVSLVDKLTGLENVILTSRS